MTAGTPPPPSKPEDDPDLSNQTATIPSQTPTFTGLVHRKKGTTVRSWLVLDSTAQTMRVEAGKHSIMRRTGLPGRDLRILDPLLSYPSTVLGRERAIVINLEHIKAIITAQEVLLLNSKDPSVTPFVNELQRRIQLHYQANQSKESAIDDTNCIIRTTSQNLLPRISQLLNQNEEGKAEEKQGVENQEGTKILPFEFVALEACLEAACGCLESETRTLEQEAHPALDRLTSKISTLNLERVRQIKSRLVAITGRVQKVRDELEHLLDDDGDMAEMYLTEKQQTENSSTPSLDERDELDEQEEVVEPDKDESTPAEAPLTSGYEGEDTQDSDRPRDHSFDAAIGRGSDGSCSSSDHSFIGKQFNVQELEMLLEAYFVQVDGTLNKLSTLREYVDDTEDYINIMLDDKQNHLLRMGVMLSTATLVISAFVVVAGVFGMNIHIDLFDDDKAGMPEFLWTIGGSTAGTVFLYVIAIAWCKYKGLLG
ncbi:ARABIDOPSIS THALIANA MAGNESIUM TRANSPORT 4, magnesium transporter 4 [Hibiscus trionum]|uniref:Magnesium transporter n=1 Tax=Hibiscus trionum TaxID=183268 RepID=A0A9W7I132_HIBTR|nr:ARABIDOPSIS THALIANA MAGNESIUM TRANSPORT 4, magnesium transporter 4 [Hibiscus trionum]